MQGRWDPSERSHITWASQRSYWLWFLMSRIGSSTQEHTFCSREEGSRTLGGMLVVMADLEFHQG